MSFILDNFGRTLQKRKESATMILISENYKTGGSKMSGQRYTVNAMGEQCPIPVVKTKSSGQHSGRCRDRSIGR